MAAAAAPAILMLTAVLLLSGARLTQLHRLAGTVCLCALAASGFALSRASGVAGAASAEIALDPFSVAICWEALGLGLLLTLSLMQLERLASAAPETFAGMLLSLAGVMLIGLARDLLVLGLALELSALPALINWSAAPLRATAYEAAVKQFLLGLLATAVFWLGIAILYGISGTTSLTETFEVIARGRTAVEPASIINGTMSIGLPAAVLLLAGIAMRIPLAPFHFGTPELAEAASVWHAALAATVPRLAGFAALWKLFGPAWGGLENSVSLLLLVVAAATMLVGSVMARAEVRVLRMLAYTTLAHGGFAVMGVAVGGAAGLFYLAGYLLSVAGLFAVLCYLSQREREIEYLDDLNGLIHSEPVAAGCALVCLLNLAGLPPLPLFWGNLFLTLSAFAVPNETAEAPLALMHGGFIALAVLAAGATLLLASVYLRLVSAMFLQMQVGRPRPAGGEAALAAAVLAAMLSLGIGLLPQPLLEQLERLLERA